MNKNLDILFKNIYNTWLLSSSSSYNISLIKHNLMFRKFLYNQYRFITCFDIFINKVDTNTRIIYLSQKYSNKWLKKYINTKSHINTTDLELNEIDEKNESKIYINYIDYKERKRYIFTSNDFKKIVRTNLEHSYMYDIIPEPVSIKNPYTNKEFTKTELRMFNSILLDMPLSWNMYVDCNYNLLDFKYKYYDYLLPLCIPSYVDQLDDDDIIYYLNQIFNHGSIDFCTKCIYSLEHIRTKKVKDILIDWIRYIKLGTALDSTIKKLRHIYGRQYCIHTNNNNTNHTNNNTNEFVLNLDFSKDLFCIGYYKNK
jgi:hypothetical protein